MWHPLQHGKTITNQELHLWSLCNEGLLNNAPLTSKCVPVHTIGFALNVFRANHSAYFQISSLLDKH